MFPVKAVQCSLRSSLLGGIDSVVGQKLAEDLWVDRKGFVQPTAELQKLRFSHKMSFYGGPHLIPATGGRTTLTKTAQPAMKPPDPERIRGRLWPDTKCLSSWR